MKNLIHSRKADVLIAAGGGRVMDTAKLAASYAKVPIITIPTIPATCAAFTTLSVMYNSKGQQTEYIYRETAPEAVVVDKEILSSAPLRYFYAGVADSVVKKYEIATNYNPGDNDFAIRLQDKICDLICEFLEDDFWGELAK
ncbi:iron-containing alcohol dehydrogenase, partial [Treponema sp. R6D11]